MRSLAIINQKGGVGKTTTAVNLSAALAAGGQRIGLIDLDPQAHASLHLGLGPQGSCANVYEVLTGAHPLGAVWQGAEANLWVAPSHIDL
ncbi:MAG TPA: AAA family ATPase, partial [Lacipirellulaceae bacterium]|nr:AAA family ATPase [Lacipirellulaceae bacterium]